MVICAHHATLIYNDTPGNAASRFICNANSPPDRANAAQQPDTEGANCAEVAGSNMRAHNWRTRSVCVKNNLHIASTVSERRWNVISWNTCCAHGQHFLRFLVFNIYTHFLGLFVQFTLSNNVNHLPSKVAWIKEIPTHATKLCPLHKTSCKWLVSYFLTRVTTSSNPLLLCYLRLF